VTRAEKLLRELIALPSVNPAFLPPGHPHAGEKRVGDFLAATMGKAGLEVEFQKVLPGRSNLIARLLPSGRVRRRVLLAPHLDTVNAEESQFSPRVRNGRMFGRGACDTKGSVAAMVSALCDMAEHGPHLKETELTFAGLVDEENGQEGSRALVKSGMRADLGIVGEPTSLRLATAHKGSMWLKLETRGKAAHGAQPELGKNAVHAMASVVDWLETDYARLLRKRTHALLGSATVSVGAISGGTQANIVPDECSILVDRRTLPGEEEPQVKRELARLLRKCGFSATIESHKNASCLPLETNPKLPLVSQLLSVLGQKGPAGVKFFCDASVLSRGGIPSVVFGPGDIAYAHTPNEWIPIKELNHATALLAKFLLSLEPNRL